MVLKKSLAFIVLLIVVQAVAQKDVNIHNISTFYKLYIAEIRTNGLTEFPFYTSNYTGPTYNQIVINPQRSYGIKTPLEPIFPFYSPTSLPVITSWTKVTGYYSSEIWSSQDLNYTQVAKYQQIKSITFQAYNINGSFAGTGTVIVNQNGNTTVFNSPYGWHVTLLKTATNGAEMYFSDNTYVPQD